MSKINDDNFGPSASGKRGPKPKPPGAKVLKKTVSLRPATVAFLSARGGGVLSKGIEDVVEEANSLLPPRKSEKPTKE